MFAPYIEVTGNSIYIWQLGDVWNAWIWCGLILYEWDAQYATCLLTWAVPWKSTGNISQATNPISSSSSSSSKFYFQQNTTMEQYQEKENTL